MSFVSEEVRQFLLQHPVLELTEGGKVRCTLTGHEVPCTLSAVKNFTEGKKYKRLSSCGSFDYSVYKPHIVPSNKNPKQLFCKLTVRHINRIPEHVQKHVQGKRYQRALAQYVECQKQGLQYVPPCLKNKKKPPRDRADKGPSGKKESWEAMDKESGDSDSGDSMSDLYPDHLFTKTTSAEPNGNTKRSGEEEAMEVEEESTQNKRKQKQNGPSRKRFKGQHQKPKRFRKAPGKQ
uniref:Surfeit 2 n=1 Tax=Leptobrachium leishanense TaxID=445787 RepID=A0A8C5R7L4_9ANUR